MTCSNKLGSYKALKLLKHEEPTYAKSEQVRSRLGKQAKNEIDLADEIALDTDVVVGNAASSSRPTTTQLARRSIHNDPGDSGIAMDVGASQAAKHSMNSDVLLNVDPENYDSNSDSNAQGVGTLTVADDVAFDPDNVGPRGLPLDQCVIPDYIFGQKNAVGASSVRFGIGSTHTLQQQISRIVPQIHWIPKIIGRAGAECYAILFGHVAFPRVWT